MQYSNLADLITFLEYGTELHIGILFFGYHWDERLSLPSVRGIHNSIICREMKNTENGFKRCFKCRNAAINKALCAKEPFGGFCINGVYEYTRPVFIEGDLACIIFIGNIYQDNKRARSFNKRLLNTMEKAFSSEDCKSLGAVIESYIRMILANPAPKEIGVPENPLIKNIKQFIEANLEFKIDLAYLAQLFHYNAKYLGRLFQDEVGSSFNEYVNELRLSRAKAALLESNASVISISESVGYSNVSYFNHKFKVRFNMTPTQYRKQYKKIE